MRNDVLCGIVTYNPVMEKLSANIEAIIEQVDTVLIVDNGSKEFEKIEKLKSEKVDILGLGMNKGIAYALNEIVKYSKKKRKSWILFLDQDSISPNNLVDDFITAWYQCDHCGMLSPNIVYKNGPVENPKELVTSKEWCITSGSFTKTEIIEKTNGFDEKMFIDLVDFDICYQLKNLGYKIYQINSVNFYHELGNLKYKKIGDKILWIENHNAFRKYYIIRNRLYLKRKYRLNGLPIYIDILIEYIKVIFFEKDKIEKIKNMSQGFIDARKMSIDI